MKACLKSKGRISQVVLTGDLSLMENSMGQQSYYQPCISEVTVVIKCLKLSTMERMSTDSIFQLSFANRALDYGPVSPAINAFPFSGFLIVLCRTKKYNPIVSQKSENLQSFILTL